MPIGIRYRVTTLFDAARAATSVQKRPSSDNLEEVQRAVEADPGDSQLRFQLGMLLCEHNRYSEAVPELLRARQSRRCQREALELLAVAYDRLGMRDLSIFTLRKLKKLNPRD